MVMETQALDMWALFVHYVFGGFWIAIIGIALVIFIIMGVLGRISIYSVTWYEVMFILAMTLGYGYVTINVLITAALLMGFIFSFKSYLDTR